MHCLLISKGLPQQAGLARSESFVRRAVVKSFMPNPLSSVCPVAHHWSLTRIDVLLCIVPIALFLSIVSLV
ncbi:MAG: hypothetical protein DWH98_08025 [Planctomycetota bacterium]|jgi:hypothetical protein|nr:MAG: hypothetical protein DWH98_08025 [Planctomycetota bacterium]